MANLKVNRVSGVILALNEEKIIGRALDDIKPHVNELIVVDGGSEDSTVDICHRRFVTVYTYSWKRHFGDIRNFAIQQCKGDWILMLDADEIFSAEFYTALPSLVSQTEFDAYKIPRENSLDSVRTEVYPDYQIRLFRSYCRWIFGVHEECAGWKKGEELGKEYCILHNKSGTRAQFRNKEWEKMMVEEGKSIK